jgi:hypothetical protein
VNRWLEGGVTLLLAALLIVQAALPALDPIAGRPALALAILASGVLAAGLGAWRSVPALTVGAPVAASLALLAVAPSSSREAFATVLPWSSWVLTLVALMALGLPAGGPRPAASIVHGAADGDGVVAPVGRGFAWLAAWCLVAPAMVVVGLSPTSHLGQSSAPLLRHGVLIVTWSVVLYVAFVGPASAGGFRGVSWPRAMLGAGMLALVVAYWAC